MYFLHLDLSPEELRRRVESLWQDPACGKIFRVKGFLPAGGGWLELNATRDQFTFCPIPQGQEVLIVIGEGLAPQAIADRLGAELPV